MGRHKQGREGTGKTGGGIRRWGQEGAEPQTGFGLKNTSVLGTCPGSIKCHGHGQRQDPIRATGKCCAAAQLCSSGPRTPGARTRPAVRQMWALGWRVGAMGSYFLSPATHEEFVSPTGRSLLTPPTYIQRSLFALCPPQLCKGQGCPTNAIPTHPENSTTQTVPPWWPCVGTPRRRSCPGAGTPQIWPPVPGQSRAPLSQTKRELTEFLLPAPPPPPAKKKKSLFVFSVWGSDSAHFLRTGKKRAAALEALSATVPFIATSRPNPPCSAFQVRYFRPGEVG